MEFNLDMNRVFTFSKVSLNVVVVCELDCVLVDCTEVVSLCQELRLERFDLIGCNQGNMIEGSSM